MRGDLDRPTEEALDWFLRLHGQEAGAADRLAFEAWLARDPAHADAYARVTALWESPEFARAVAASASPSRRRRRVPRPALAIAGALAAALGLALGAARIAGVSRVPWADYRTGTGERRVVALGDGSRVALNTASALDVDLEAARRRVRLRAGEAYFEVAADPQRPFEVVSGPATIRVAGTAFSAHRDGGRVRVVVRRGEVAVRHEGVGPEVLLRAGEALEVTAAGPSRRQAVDPDEAFDWLDGRIRFRRRPLGEVLDELRRHLRGWIVVADGRLAAVEVSGSYRLDDPAAVVASLADVAGARLLRLSDHLLVLY